MAGSLLDFAKTVARRLNLGADGPGDLGADPLVAPGFVQAQKMEVVGRIAGGVAHDFNNYLTTIRGNAQLAREQLPADSPLQQELAEIVRSADRAAGIVRQILAFSRAQPPQLVPVDLNRLVREMEGLFRRLAGGNVALDLHLQTGAPPVLADPVQLQQVLMNLVVNARDALPRGGVIRIETHDTRSARVLPSWVDPGEAVALAVCDDGVGMDEETLAHAFEPFFTTKHDGKGTGLGLAIVHAIIEALGGRVDVRTAPGKGTRMVLYLPRAEGDLPLAEIGPDPGVGATGSETVLVIEDDAGVRSLIRRTLQRRGYEVLEAASGSEAVDVSRTYRGIIDVVLSDVGLPGMQVREILTRLRAQRPGARTILTSGYPEEELGDRLPAANSYVFLPKPFSPQALADVVRQTLDQPRGD